MELKEGMYVRTNYRKEKVIRKIVKIVEDSLIHDYYLIFDKSTKYTYYVEDNDFRASDDITDLIKSGDVIETPKGIFKVGYIENNVIYTDDSKIIACLRKDEHLCFENTTIKSIVTKENFNSVKYEV